jgi:DNA-binding response OmpR family regulator
MTTRILIADADRDLTETYREHLEGIGLAVRTATDGAECVNLLREFRPDLLLLSTSLPWAGCDGVLALIREEPDLRPEFLLILAARPDRNVLYRVASSHIDDYQFKPLSPLRLERYIRDLLKERTDIAIQG